MSEAEGLLAQLLDEAVLDSSGRLTVDRQAEARKLSSQWGFSREQVLLLAVQLAHAAGWGTVSFELEPNLWTITFHSISGEEIQALLTAADGGVGPELRSLVHRFKLAMLACSEQVVSEPPEPMSLKLRLHLSESWLKRCLSFLGWGIPEWHKLLVRRCALARLNIFLNGQRVHTGLPEDLPALRFSPSLWRLQYIYYENGPWMVESYQPVPARTAESFVLASRAVRAGSALQLNGQTYNCFGPKVPFLEHGGRSPARLCTSFLSVLEGQHDARVRVLTPETDPDNSELLKQVSLRLDWIMGVRPRATGTKGTRTVHDYVLYAEGLAQTLSSLTTRVRPFPLTHCAELDVPGFHVQRWVGLRGLAPLTSQLTLIKHGVALDPVKLDSPLALSGLLADDSVKTDLSGLKVVEDDRVREHCRQVQARLPELVGYLRDYRDPGDCPLGGRFIPDFQHSLQQARELKC